MNQNVTHFNKTIFGEDAEEYKPERWIGKDDRTLAAMNRHLHTFGYGNRTCLGKTVSIVALFRR